MKKILFILALVLLTTSVSANSIRLFTRGQAVRTAQYLNQQQEIVIYCGYANEIPTYALVSDVWYETYNSAYYEIWLYAFDAYTGEEIYMPIDLSCIWLYSGNRIYSAATYLRFRNNRPTPTFAWYVPPYNPFTHIPHPTHYRRTYHYDVHQHGWAPQYNNPHYAPYYLRRPHEPVPMPSSSFTPGVNRPTVVRSHAELGNNQGGRTATTTSQAPTNVRNHGSQTATTRPTHNGNGTSKTRTTTSTSTNNTSRESGSTSHNNSTTTRPSSSHNSSNNSGTRSTGSTATPATTNNSRSSSSKSSNNVTTPSNTRSSNTTRTNTTTAKSNNSRTSATTRTNASTATESSRSTKSNDGNNNTRTATTTSKR